ncbi:GIY-YIG nuclease family protein [Paraburkholderia sp.]|uniref:GIY-YIG nuclease family protein n=1 Tax=Paraburkholderia sp. TaxID=1926495 RepID=UPI00343D0B6E
MSYGFVYVLGHRCMPGVYKVGYTERSPRARVEELNKSTSIPGDFDLICYAEYENPRDREQEIHRLLDAFRVTRDREFFKCDLIHITSLVMERKRPVRWRASKGCVSIQR